MGPVRKINNPKNQSIQRLCYGGDDLWKKSVIKFIKCGCEVLGRLVRLASCSVRPLPYPSSICEEQMGFRISFDYRLNSTVFWISNKTPIVYGRGNKAYFIILILLANNTIDAQNVIAFYHRFRPGGGGVILWQETVYGALSFMWKVGIYRFWWGPFTERWPFFFFFNENFYCRCNKCRTFLTVIFLFVSAPLSLGRPEKAIGARHWPYDITS